MMQEAMAAEPKPLLFREIARGDARVLTGQGKSFLSEKIRASAYSVEVVNVSWESDRRQLKQPTIYETTYDGRRFVFLLAGSYRRIVMEAQSRDNVKRFDEISFPGVDWVEFLHKDVRHRIDTKRFIPPRAYMLQIQATGIMFRVGLSEHLILERKVERGSSQGSLPVNAALRTGAGNRLRVQSRLLSDDGELALILYDHNDGDREVFNVRIDGDNHEATMEFEIPTDRPMLEQPSIFDLEAWKVLP